MKKAQRSRIITGFIKKEGKTIAKTGAERFIAYVRQLKRLDRVKLGIKIIFGRL
jgi:hypothetical protein